MSSCCNAVNFLGVSSPPPPSYFLSRPLTSFSPAGRLTRKQRKRWMRRSALMRPDARNRARASVEEWREPPAAPNLGRKFKCHRGSSSKTPSARRRSRGSASGNCCWQIAVADTVTHLGGEGGGVTKGYSRSKENNGN